MEIRPFRTDLPLRFRFLSTFNPEGREVSCYLLWFNSMNHGEMSRHKVELTETEVEDEETGETEKVWETIFLGVDQRKLGEYHIALILDENKENQQQYIVSDAFKLVLKYEYEYDEDSLRVVITIGKKVASPVLPESGLFVQEKLIEITNREPDSIVKYTVGIGEEPKDPGISRGTEGTEFTLSQLNENATTDYYVKAVAISGNYLSKVVSGLYTIQSKVLGVALSEPTGDRYSESRQINLSCYGDITGVVYRYTLDGSDPLVSSTAEETSDSIVISKSGVVLVRVVGTKEGWAPSDEVDATVELRKIYTPIISASGTEQTDRTITIVCATPGSEIHYTLDGSTPDSNSPLYKANDKPVIPLKITRGLVAVDGKVALTTNGSIAYVSVRPKTTEYDVKAIAIKADWIDSDVASEHYKAGDYQTPTCPAPEVSMPSGSIYSESRTVTASTTLQGATIKYTTDGSNPATSGTAQVYSGPVVVDTRGTTTLKFVVVKSGYDNSIVVTRQVQCRQIQNVVLSADGNEFSSSRSITMLCETAGVEIHYTLDGSTPTSNSPLYNSASKPSISTTTVVKAIAMKAGWTDSGMAVQEFVVGLGGVHYGYAGETITAEGVGNLDGFKAQLDPKGDYESTSDVNAWLWVCIDSTQTINYIMSGPFEVPMDDPITVGTYKCYRSALQHRAGTINFTVY